MRCLKRFYLFCNKDDILFMNQFDFIALFILYFKIDAFQQKLKII